MFLLITFLLGGRLSSGRNGLSVPPLSNPKIFTSATESANLNRIYGLFLYVCSAVLRVKTPLLTELRRYAPPLAVNTALYE